MIRLAAALLALMTTAVSAQVVTPGAGLRCFERAKLLDVLKGASVNERPMFSGIEQTTQVPFTWFLNFEKQTSTYVTFPQPGIACALAGIQVKFAKAEADL